MDIVNKKSGTPNRPVSRLQFLQGDFTGKRVVIRPPWALEENQFVEICTGCGECVDHCPSAILRKDRGGFPAVDFSAGQCEFCAECVSHCQTGALLLRKNPTDTPWQLKAVIGEQCLTFQSVVCRTCVEQCESFAIEFRMNAGRVPRPELDLSQCNGCGACYGSCPVNAISIRMQTP